MNLPIVKSKKNIILGSIILIIVFWHIVDTILNYTPQMLLYVCYTSNIILGIGIFLNSSNMIGIGVGWLLIGFPLWLIDSILFKDVQISGMFFHVVSLIIGLYLLKYHKISSLICAPAIIIALVLFVFSRLFTNPEYNINAAFRIYQGWEKYFTNYHLYFSCQLLLYFVFFIVFPIISNRLVYKGKI